MIPYKLRLQNFLSYRDGVEPLDFTGMHLVCLVGDNGHGKSALLDAITWALWGKARTASDDDLMHTGQAEMQVEFEFGLAGQRYNVIRKRLLRGRSSKTELELAVWDDDANAWQPLTEPTIRATEHHIEAILRLDYETFRNSAFLKQGESDVFTRKAPGERKKVLSAILNLGRYDLYAEKAKEMAKSVAAEVPRREAELHEVETELERRPAYETELRAAELAEMQARLHMSEADQAAATARAAVQELEAKDDRRRDIERRLQQAVRRRDEAAMQLRAAEARVQETEKLLDERPAIESSYQALQSARAEVQRWESVWQARRPLEQEHEALQRQLIEARNSLDRELTLISKDLTDLQKRADGLADWQQKSATATQDLARLEELQAGLNETRQRLSVLEADRKRLEQERGQAVAEGEALRDRVQMLRSSEAAACPVCRQPLGADGRQHLDQEYETRMTALRDQVRTLQTQAKQIDQEIKALQAGVHADEQKIRQMSGLQRQLGELQIRVADAALAAAALPQRQAEVSALRRRLDERDYAAEVWARSTAVEAQMAALAYDQSALDRARATVSDLSGVERKHIALEKALAEVEGFRQQAERERARCQGEEAEVAAEQTTLGVLQRELAGLAEAKQRLQARDLARNEARLEWERAQPRLAAARQKLQACEQLIGRRQTLGLEVAALKARRASLGQLAEAFGKSGVQAMIIESALPELEAEANRLLQRLSDGRMNVRLRTQRELKSGGLSETLDIIISDEAASRPYESFSGGEAFRADLSLRIALSRVLARRAGAALQTLFIDEGFGTQDAQGRERLVEAIHLIKDEFALILVITHIDELKDQFPVRIQVQKQDGAGSRYWVT